MAEDISKAKCILLAVHFASEGSIKALRSLARTRSDDLDSDLILRILLTYLPESVDPKDYTGFVDELCSRKTSSNESQEAGVEVDSTPVKDINEQQAKRKVKRLELLDIRPSNYPEDGPGDVLPQFLYHRAYRIDEETGLINLVSQLLQPFLDRNEFLRVWCIGVVLPLMRLQFEYYPEDVSVERSLTYFQKLDAPESVDFLMHNASTSQHEERSDVARDIKGLVGPWIYGSTQRKRRKLSQQPDQEVVNGDLDSNARRVENTAGREWESVYRWMVDESREHFPLVTQAIATWDGPSDIDLGDFNAGHSDRYLDDDVQGKLEAEYMQAAFASCYAVESNSEQTIRQAHAVASRLARLLDLDAPPNLSANVQDLATIEEAGTLLKDSHEASTLDPRYLLMPDHPLTTPRQDTYNLLLLMIFSAYQFFFFNYPISIAEVAKLHLFASAEEQLAVLRRLLHGMSRGGARRDEEQWIEDRAKLVWLRNWDSDFGQGETSRAAVLGNIPRHTFEEEYLKCLIEASCYNLAINLYLKSSDNHLLNEVVEQIALSKAMEAYDGATNGNRTRGGMKKANDIISTFRPYFPRSLSLGQAIALISATHALSFYSLTLQHGVLFQPVSIRVSHDPIGLINKVLEQNSSSYTQLDDLVSIAQNLVSAGLPQKKVSTAVEVDEGELETKKKNAERRVTFMAVEAALHEDDFETAYSYIVNRLTPSGDNIEPPKESGQKAAKHARNISSSSGRSRQEQTADDISWRAAFLAGRYRSASASPSSLRRLEQRSELLSLALLLAPVSALSEILVAWRRCEEETTALQLSQQQMEQEIDDRADKRQSFDSIPGNFSVEGEQPALLLNQQRREMGRLTGKTGGGDEAPVSMFDLTRSAAQALSKNAFPLRGALRSSSGHESSAMESSVDGLGSEGGTEAQQRARKRDMVTNAVSGGLASGLGWVLGATPVSQHRPASE